MSMVDDFSQEELCPLACNTTGDCVNGCVQAAAEEETIDPVSILLAVVLLCFSALFSGLTLGLLSVDVSQLQLIIAGGSPREKKNAERILPIRRRGNLLLCTLLIGNAIVNSFLAILTATITSGVLGAVLSTGFILIFGEIIPQSVCTRHGLAIGARLVDIVRLFMLAFFIFAWPISKILDYALDCGTSLQKIRALWQRADGEELGTTYTRTELKQLFTMQAAAAAQEQGEASSAMAMGEGGIRQQEATFMCGALSLSERTAFQIMTRMSDVFFVHADDVLDYNLMRRIADSGHTRIPVLKAGTDAAAAAGAVRSDAMLGLLSTKDLILVDPEAAMPVEQLLKHCGRPVLTFWYDSPVAQLFRDFKRGRSHLAFVQQVNNEDETRDPFYELVGIVTLEDVLEELIQAEIVDESDVYVDNVSKAPVEMRNEEAARRGAWKNLLDPMQLNETSLKSMEIVAISSFLSNDLRPFAPSAISSNQLYALLSLSTIEVLDKGDEPLYEIGRHYSTCTIVLQGRLFIVCGSEGFEGELGPWSHVASDALVGENYVADFTATCLGPTRILKIARATYAHVLETVERQPAALNLNHLPTVNEAPETADRSSPQQGVEQTESS